MRTNHLGLAQFIERFYMKMIISEHGPKGFEILKEMLQAIRQLYRYVEVEELAQRLVVFKSLDDDIQGLQEDDAVRLVNLESLAQEDLSGAVLKLCRNGEVLLWRCWAAKLDITSLAHEAVVYSYEHGTDVFYAKARREVAPNCFEGRGGNLAWRTYTELVGALEQYKLKMARQCSCPILGAVWFDDKRIFLKNGPESLMRDSLTLFLKAKLEDAEVRPEQNVDASHPIDIKVSWSYAQRQALIEIKWMGRSRHPDGRHGQDYSGSRANTGARQLANYLDANKQQAPAYRTRGYLVVFDARRFRVKDSGSIIDRIRGMHYADKEVKYDPRYDRLRSDFASPMRMFVEPILG